MCINQSGYIERCLKIKLNQGIKDLLNTQAQIVTFHKGQHPVCEGDRMDAIYFLIVGLVRGYYIDEEGNEVTKCFSQENQFFSSEGFRTNAASTFFIECLEECKCIKIPYAVIRSIKELNSDIHNLYLNEVARLEYRVKNLMLMNAYAKDSRKYHVRIFSFC